MTLPSQAASDAWPLAETAGADALILQVRDCMATGVSRNLLLLRLSALPPGHTRPLYLRLARAALAPLAVLSRVRLFQLPDETLVVVWRGDPGEALHRTAQALGELLLEGSSGRSVADLAAVQRLPQDGPAMLRLLHKDETAETLMLPQPSEPGRALDRAALERLERALAGANVARFVRRRQIWQIARGAPTAQWEKRTLSVGELTATLEPGLVPDINSWLFRRLTRSLDERMLSLLASVNELQDAGPFSIDINAASILGPAFLRFDASLPAPLRGEVVLELLAADMLADPALFLFARNFARARRYRLLLRGLTPALLPVFPLNRVELDYLRLDWYPAMASDGTAAAIRATGDAARILLCGVELDEALDWACALGIAYFQGAAAERHGLTAIQRRARG